MSIRELKAYVHEHGGDTTNCIEKRDLVKRAERASKNPSAPPAVTLDLDDLSYMQLKNVLAAQGPSPPPLSAPAEFE